jgi:hypothetical protein
VFRHFRHILVTLALSSGLLTGAGSALAEPSLQERILENKYRWGDYAIFIGWYEPRGEQFEEHASYALPVGVKVRLKWGARYRLEGEFSYYRRSDEPALAVSVFTQPEFDGLMMMATFQVMLVRSGWIRPYVGAGPAFVSLSNDFVVKLCDELVIDCFALGSWSEFDVGGQVVAGLDLRAGSRAFPFVEFRYLFGELGYDHIRIGAFGFDPADLETPDGETVSDKHDWGGPMVSVGLKIRF